MQQQTKNETIQKFLLNRKERKGYAKDANKKNNF
jgi:hypothetical protein